MALGPSLDEISQLLISRRSNRGVLFEKMRSLRDTYNGEVVIPMPEMSKDEKPAVANLITQGLDQTSMRIASTMPNIFCPPVREGIESSEKKARARINANLGWWQANKMSLLMRKRARHLIGYSNSPVMIRPNTKLGIARWDVKSPLDTYAPLNDDSLNFTPEDIIFSFTRSRRWLIKFYPEAASILQTSGMATMDDPIEIVEYNDGDCFVMMALSDYREQTTSGFLNKGQVPGGHPFAELSRTPNRTGMCMAVIPSRITLDKPMGQFDSLLGMYELQAKLTALHLIAVEKYVYPDTYLISNPGQIGKFVHGPVDGRTGEVNVVQDGQIEVKTPIPNQATDMAIDRLERAQRIASGTPADMTGESQSNVRTGRRGDSIMSATIDFSIQENQDILATALEEENKRAIAIAKNYFGNERKSFYVTGLGKNVDYVANDIFENDNNTVVYSQSGSDVNGLVVAIGQRVGMETMSIQTAQELDPFIANPEREKDRVLAETVDKLLVASLSAQSQSGEITPTDLAKIRIYVKTNQMGLAEAMVKVHEEAQARQAEQAPQGTPETMPGLGAPGQGAEQPVQGAPAQGRPSLQDLMGQLSGVGG